MIRVKTASHSFLIHNFREFFNLLLRQKEFALRATGNNDPYKLKQQLEEPEAPQNLTQDLEQHLEDIKLDQQTDPLEQLEFLEEPKPEPVEPPQNPVDQNPEQHKDTHYSIVNKIQRRLSLLLEEQAIASTLQAGEFATSSYQDALYAMVAFADEVFLNIPWAGQKEWEDNLLESRFFQTQIAGELLFQKIETLVSTNDPMRADLAMVYLLILGLGFKGKFRGEDENQKQLSTYRYQLYTMINRHPSTLYTGRSHLIEDCYEHVLDSTLSKGLPEIRLWLLTFAGILATYLFVSSILWYKLVKGMNESIGHVLQQAHQMGLS